MATDEAFAVHSLFSKEAERKQWSRFGRLLVETGLEAVAANPQLVGVRGKTEALVGAFASKVELIVEADQAAPDGGPISFVQLAATTLLRVSIETIATDPTIVTSDKQLAEFVGSFLGPLAKAQADTPGLVTLDRLTALLKGPMAQAALKSLKDHQDDLVGKDLKTKTALGAVTQELLAAWTTDKDFNITETFSQRGLAAIYTSALTAVEKRPELFIKEAGSPASTQVWRTLLKGIAEVMAAAPPPFTNDPTLGEKLANVVVGVAADHLALRITKDAANEDAWGQATGQILKSILIGFKEGMGARAKDPSINPFSRVFSRDQTIEIVRILATQAAKSPEMLGLNSKDHKNELYGIAQAVAAFMANPNTKLASADDWRAVIAVAVEEAARNPGALFKIDPTPTPEQHLAYALVTMMLAHAAAALRAPAGGGDPTSSRRLGSVLFGSTLTEAISITFRAAANNARALLVEPTPLTAGQKTHLTALSDFVGELQKYADAQKGRIGAAEWLWLFRYYVAEVIEEGPNLNVSAADFEKALKTAGLAGSPDLEEGAVT